MKKQIKIYIETILFVLCKLVSIVYSYQVFNTIKKIKLRLYTYWLSSEFKKVGENSLLHYPINLLGGKHITIGDKTGIGARGIITAWDKRNGEFFTPEIKIGNNVWIGEDCHITSMNKIEIGNYVLIGKKVTITDNSHGKTDIESMLLVPKERSLFSKGPVVIEDNVWIGDKATILPGVRIGKNSIIGANSVVTKGVDENCVVAGNPAIVIKGFKK